MTSSIPVPVDAVGVEAVLLVVLSWSVRASVVLGLTWVGVRLVRRASAASRHLIWLTSLVAVSLLPVLTLTVPWRWEVDPASTIPSFVSTAPAGGEADARAETGAAPEASGAAADIHGFGSDGPGIEGVGIGRRSTRIGTRGHLDGRPGRDRLRTGGGESLPGGVASQESVLRGRTGDEPPRATGPGEPAGWGSVLALLLGLGSVAALLFLVRGRIELARARRQGREPRCPGWQDRIRRLAARAGVEDEVEILESPRISVPLTVGIFRSRILLPEGATARWPSDRLDAVLLHELGHVRRRDVLSHLLGRILCAVHWFNPLVWLAARHMTRACERACDDLVLRTGIQPSDYAEHLLEIVRSEKRRRMLVPGLAMARKGDFEGRILALLDPDASRETVRRDRVFGVVGVVGLLALLVSMPAVGGASSVDGKPPSIQSTLSETDRVETTLARTLIELLEDPHSRVRAAAARSLGERRSRTALPALVNALRDSDDDVREEAALALGRIGDTGAVADLARVLREDDDEDVRESAAWALGESEGPDAVKHLADALGRVRRDRVRADIVEALGETRQPAAVQVLAELLSEGRGRVRSQALEALVEIGSDEAMNVIIEAMRSDDSSLRRAAAEALSEG